MSQSTNLQSITLISYVQSDRVEPSTITVAGWVRTRRSSKKFSFIELNDGSCAKSLQIIVDNSLENYQEVENLTMGCSVKIQGHLVLSPAKGQKYELQATQVELLGPADPENYPLQKKDMTLEYLR